VRLQRKTDHQQSHSGHNFMTLSGQYHVLS